MTGVEFSALLAYFDGHLCSILMGGFHHRGRCSSLHKISVLGEYCSKTLNFIKDYNNNYNCIKGVLYL